MSLLLYKCEICYNTYKDVKDLETHSLFDHQKYIEYDESSQDRKIDQMIECVKHNSLGFYSLCKIKPAYVWLKTNDMLPQLSSSRENKIMTNNEWLSIFEDDNSKKRWAFFIKRYWDIEF